MDHLDRETIINILMYGILIAFVIFRFVFEIKDVQCPDVFNSTSEECKKYGGMCFSYTNPEPTDSCEILLNKIVKAGGAECRSIKWRRALFLSVVIMFLIWMLVISPGELPKWTVFYLCTLISFVILYSVFNWYSAHVYNNVENNISMAVKMLQSKGFCNSQLKEQN